MAADVWDLVRGRPRVEKGFDHGWGWWSQVALPPLPELASHEVRVECQLDQQLVQGTLWAICELAGYWVSAYSVNPDRRPAAESTYTIACELEQMAGALRIALEQRLEQDDHDETEE